MSDHKSLGKIVWDAIGVYTKRTVIPLRLEVHLMVSSDFHFHENS